MEKEEFEKPVSKSNMKNQPCFDSKGNPLGWFSRSMAVVGIVFCKMKNGNWCVLASQRGKGTPDDEFVGKWNCVCGYLDYNETLQEAVQREVHEETGLKLVTDRFHLESINDRPKEDKRQNVTFRFSYFIMGKNCEDIHFTHAYNEKDEVDGIMFMPLKDIDKYEWAFNHNPLIKEIASKHGLI